MAEYIEREALLIAFGEEPQIWIDEAAEVQANDDWHVYTGTVKALPAADVAPVVHGRWVEREDFNFDIYYDCSACGESFCFIEGVPEENFYSYCPNCGAKMDGDGQ